MAKPTLTKKLLSEFEDTLQDIMQLQNSTKGQQESELKDLKKELDGDMVREVVTTKRQEVSKYKTEKLKVIEEHIDLILSKCNELSENSTAEEKDLYSRACFLGVTYSSATKKILENSNGMMQLACKHGNDIDPCAFLDLTSRKSEFVSKKKQALLLECENNKNGSACLEVFKTDLLKKSSRPNVKYLEKSCEYNEPLGCQLLAMASSSSEETMIKHLNKSCELGNGRSCSILTHLLLADPNKDDKKIEEMGHKAISTGYCDPFGTPHTILYSMSSNQQDALKYIIDGCNRCGDAQSCLVLANVYEHGALGQKKNIPLANTLYAKSCGGSVGYQGCQEAVSLRKGKSNINFFE